MLKNNNATVGEQVGLIPYLAKLGLGDADLTRVMSLLETTQRPYDPPVAIDQEPLPAVQEELEPEWDIPKNKDFDFDHNQAKGLPATKTIRLFLAEEQQILKEAYQSFFSHQPGIELLDSSHDTSAEFLIAAAREYQPNVMLLGVKMAEGATVEKLESLREACPGLAPGDQGVARVLQERFFGIRLSAKAHHRYGGTAHPTNLFGSRRKDHHRSHGYGGADQDRRYRQQLPARAFTEGAGGTELDGQGLP